MADRNAWPDTYPLFVAVYLPHWEDEHIFSITGKGREAVAIPVCHGGRHSIPYDADTLWSNATETGATWKPLAPTKALKKAAQARR